MTETGTPPSVDVAAQAPAAPARKRPTAWLILTGILVILLLVTWIRGALTARQLTAQYTKRIAQLTHDADVSAQQALQSKALALASSMQMINPAILAEDGEKMALGYFKTLLDGDDQIDAIVFYDAEGRVCATTNMRISDRDTAITRVTKVTLRPVKGGFEAIGPLTDAEEQTIGAVRVVLHAAQPAKK